MWDGVADGTFGGTVLLQRAPEVDRRGGLVPEEVAWRSEVIYSFTGISTASRLECSTWAGFQRKDILICLELVSFRVKRIV